MRIACLSRIVTSHGIHGGMERHLDVLAAGLVERGHSVEVFTTADPEGREAETIGGSRHHYLRAPSGRYSRAWSRESRRAIVDRWRTFDVLWGQGAGAESVARLSSDSRPPLVSILHGTLFGEAQTKLRSIHSLRGVAVVALLYWRHLSWRAHVTQARTVVAASHQVAERVRDLYQPLPKLEVIPNGVDTHRFTPAPESRTAIRERLSLPTDAKVLICVGRLEREKGIHQAIEMLAQLGRPDVQLLIVGEGEAEGQLHHLAERHGLSHRVRLVGFVPHEDIPAYLNAADVFVMPTLREEGFPFAIAEAMACGLPVVATNIGGIPTAIDNGENGLLFPVGGVQALTAQVNRLLDETRLPEMLGGAARIKAVAHFSVRKMVDDTVAVLQEAANGDGPRSSSIPYGLD